MATQEKTIIERISPTIATFSRPFKRFGLVPIGVRATAIRMEDGNVFIFSPTILDHETEAVLREMGNVKYLACPNIVHHLFVGDYKKKWPEAVVMGVPGLAEKRPDVSFFMDASETNKTFGFESEFEYRLFSASRNKDVLFLHKPTRTLLSADLIFNLPPTTHYPPGHSFGFPWTWLYPYLTPASSFHKFFLKKANTNLHQQTIDAQYCLQKWNGAFDTIIPAHGNIITKDAQIAFNSAFEYVAKPQL